MAQGCAPLHRPVQGLGEIWWLPDRMHGRFCDLGFCDLVAKQHVIRGEDVIYSGLENYTPRLSKTVILMRDRSDLNF